MRADSPQICIFLGVKKRIFAMFCFDFGDSVHQEGFEENLDLNVSFTVWDLNESTGKYV